MKMKLVVICDIATLTTVPHLLLIPATCPPVLSRLSRCHVTCDSWAPAPALLCVTQCSNLVNIGICATLSHIINRTQTLACLALINKIGCSTSSVCYYKCAILLLFRQHRSVDSGNCFPELWTLLMYSAIVTIGASHPPPQLPPLVLLAV